MIGGDQGGGARSIFAGYHPIINFLYFGYVVLVPIFFMHPMILGISFIAAITYAIYLGGRRTAVFALGFVLPVMIVAALFNPAFNHRGVTILFYFYYNPITLEAIIYGLASATMIGSVILWFVSYNAIMTSDKFIYLFGRIVPAISLIISMALRLVPLYIQQTKKIISARRGIGFDVSSGKFMAKVRSGVEILSVMITWALESGIETGDSMLARGYGLPGRTAYSNYRFDARDKTLLVVFLVLMAVSVTGILTGLVSVEYYNRFVLSDIQPLAAIIYLSHAAVCFLPFALEVREEAVWRSLRSKI